MQSKILNVSDELLCVFVSFKVLPTFIHNIHILVPAVFYFSIQPWKASSGISFTVTHEYFLKSSILETRKNRR